MSTKRRRIWRNDLVALAFLLPFTVLYVVFTIYPVGQGIYMSLFRWGLMGKQGYIGADNYARFLGDRFFWGALWNTTKFVLYSTPTIILLSLGLALLANRRSPLKRLYRAAYFTPNLLSVSVISFLTIYMLQPYGMGFISNLMKTLGMREDVFFLRDPQLVWVSIVGATAWWTCGYNMMLYISALQDIPDQLYEAAAIDGASPSRQLWSITLPLLKPTTLLILLLQLIASFKVFAQIRLITNGGPGNATRPLIQYIYESAFDKNRLGYAAAMSYALFLILVVLALIQLWMTRETER
ncbi:MAG: sugar ABC transporter permease [Clostridiales bacterium]|mgnify:CR=1 FL=1|nr:sugar ABC transporter permease [Clostridiales bacterium]